MSVAGGITSASKTNDSGKSTITVNFASQGGTNYTPIISFQSLGTVDNDNDFEEPVIRNLTATSFQVYLHETNSVTQNLRMHVILMKY